MHFMLIVQAYIIIILSTIDKIHFKTNIIDGSKVNVYRQPILHSFVLDTPAGYKVLFQPETVHHKKTNLF